MSHANTSYVCLPCRASYKQPYGMGWEDRVCPRCARVLIHAGSAFAAPGVGTHPRGAPSPYC